MQDLRFVRVPGGGGAVGVQDERPAPPVDHDLVVEETEQRRSLWCWSCRRSPCACTRCTSHARGGLVAASRPPAVLVAQGDGVADPGRDGLGVADVQRQAGAAEAGAEFQAAQERGQPTQTESKSTALPMMARPDAGSAQCSKLSPGGYGPVTDRISPTGAQRGIAAPGVLGGEAGRAGGPAGGHPGRTGGPWLCRTLVLSVFQAVVVPSGFRTSVQPHRWITTWWWNNTENTVFGAGLAAVLLVPDVVDLARARRAGCSRLPTGSACRGG